MRLRWFEALTSDIAKGIGLIALGAGLWFVADPVYHLVWDALKIFAPILRLVMYGAGALIALVGLWWVLDGLVEMIGRD